MGNWKSAALVLLASAGLASAQSPVDLTVDVPLVSLEVHVSDANGKPVTGLTKDDFVVYEDGHPQQVQSFATVGIPYNILVLVDRSPRAQDNPWPDVLLRSVSAFLQGLRGPDRLAIAGFDKRIAMLLDWRTARNGHKQSVLIRPSNASTDFYEAVDWGLRELRNINGPKGVIVFTDGRDSRMYPEFVLRRGQGIPDPAYQVPASAETRFQKTLQAVQRSGIPFYFVAIDTDRQLRSNSPLMRYAGWMRFLTQVRSNLEQLADASGGRVFYPQRMEDVIPFYRQIYKDLGMSYSLAYTPDKATQTGDFHHVEVRTRDASLKVLQSRDGYPGK